MGQDIDFDVDVDQVKVSSGDKILICSDGVTNMVDLEEIEQLCKTSSPKFDPHSYRFGKPEWRFG